MGLNISPRVVTNGLTFYYDEGNIKSYRGPAIQNLASTIGFNNATRTGMSIIGSYESVDVPQIGRTTVTSATIQNNYNSFTPNSTDCCPSPFFYGNGIAVSPSTVYTYAIVYKVHSGYTNSNYMYRYEFTANGGTLVTEAGVHNEANRIHLGGGWYWAWATFTTRAETNWIGYHAAFYYRYSNTIDKMSIAKVLLCRGDFTRLHPKYWPEVNTTRSNTQSATDLTGRRTITSNSLLYNPDGTLDFDGTTSYLSTVVPTTATRTVSMFYKLNNPGTGWGPLWRFDDWKERIFPNTINFINSNGTYYYLDGPDSSTNIIHIAYSYSGTNAKSYKNGVLQSNITMDGPMDSGNFTYNFGRQSGGSTTAFVDMSLYSVQFYDNQLTDAQVLQNFNALRGRYGI